VTGGEGRDFGPSQCWKQIDVAMVTGVEHITIVTTVEL